MHMLDHLCLWIGMGVGEALFCLLQHYATTSGCNTGNPVVCLFVPYTDGKPDVDYLLRPYWLPDVTSARTYLMSLLQETGNPIIFTNGDNDTFPLWYNNPGNRSYRTDVCTRNLSH